MSSKAQENYRPHPGMDGPCRCRQCYRRAGVTPVGERERLRRERLEDRKDEEWVAARDPAYEEDMATALLQEARRKLKAAEGNERLPLLTVVRGLAKEARWWRNQRLKALLKENEQGG